MALDEPPYSWSEEDQREFINKLDARLATAYGTNDVLHRPPLDELVLTVLSQNTNDRNRDLAFRSLRSRWPTWEDIAEALLTDLIECLKPAGLAPQKAPRIQAIVRRALSGELPLDTLSSLSAEEARSLLLSEPGVGVKTAHCVLLFSYGMPVFPMDTHILRVFERIGLTPEKHNVEREHVRFSSLVGVGRHKDFHLNVITHGRRVCKARSPLCGQCIISDVCRYYQAVSERSS